MFPNFFLVYLFGLGEVDDETLMTSMTSEQNYNFYLSGTTDMLTTLQKSKQTHGENCNTELKSSSGHTTSLKLLILPTNCWGRGKKRKQLSLWLWQDCSGQKKEKSAYTQSKYQFHQS